MVLIAGAIQSASAQQPATQTPADDVLRVNTELVQSAITVLDKKGKFVTGLERGDFELVVDGKPRPISFLERVTAGSTKEAQLDFRKQPESPTTGPQPAASVRGRSIVFFIDDLHLSLSSLSRTRQMIAHFLETEMSSKDSIAIASSKGQIGFLQQFTNNREVLRAALARVMPQPAEDRTIGMGHLAMSEYTAMQIETKPDSRTNNVLAVYIEECLKQTGFMGGDRRTALNVRANCERLVKSNARNVLLHTGQATERTYQTLESLMRSSARFPGRKLVFFISDGFMAQGGPLGNNLSNKLKQITDAAQSANTVIYSIDARGLVSGTLDATNNLVPDANGRMASVAAAEILATQDALNALAEDTGGRALRNQNYFDVWVDKVLAETSNYYVLAWRPSTEAEKESKFRNIKISVVGRPELTVRAPRGYIEQASENVNKTEVAEAKKKSAELGSVLSDYYPSNSLPTALSLTHLNTPANGPLLTSSFQVAGSSLDFGEAGKQPATVKLAGVILNDKGKIAGSFQTHLNVRPLESNEPDRSAIIYNHREPLTPGIYQVRVAARDERSRRIGSAMQWIVIPDLSTHQLTLSSVLITGPVQDMVRNASAPVQLSADHRFSRFRELGYWIFIYNAKRDARGATNLTVETTVVREGKVISTALQKVSDNSADPERIPYGADVSLKSLAPGSYDLKVKITDAVAGTSATQSTDFVVQ